MAADDAHQTTAALWPEAMIRRLPPVAVLVSAIFAVMYLAAALPRILYPYDLDFIEDSMLIQSLRFAEGQPVYIAPNAEFVPHVYMPLYSWLGGLWFKILGVSYIPLRAMSFAATLTTAGLIFYVARRESGERWLGLACAGLYLGGYRLSGFWYELARVDSLYVALSTIGLAAGLYARDSLGRMILSAVILALAFFTKQTALAFGACVGVFLLITFGRRGWIFLGTWLGLIAIGWVGLNTLTGGWFFYHTFLVAGADRVEIGRAFHYLGFELFGWMAGLSVMAVAYAASAWRGAGAVRREPWLMAIGAAAVASGAGRASVGGNLNNLMPAYALLCLAPALLWKALASISATPDRARRPAWESIVAIGILVQFALGLYNPLRYIPTQDMRESGDRLIAQIASVDGPVLVMMHPYYAWRAGKEPSAQIAQLWYLLEWSGVPLPPDFVNRIRGKYYAAIISSESLFETDPAIQGLIEPYYVQAGAVDGPPTTTGVIVKPSVLYVPR